MSIRFILAVVSIAFSVIVLAEKDESVAKFEGSTANGTDKNGSDAYVPEYLKKLTEEQQKELQAIKDDENLTFKQSYEKQIEFAKKHGIENEVKQYIDDTVFGYSYMLKQRPTLIEEISELHKKFAPIEENDEMLKKDFNEQYEKLRKDHPVAMEVLELLSDRLLEESVEKHNSTTTTKN